MKLLAVGNANIDVSAFIERIPDQDEAIDALAATMSAGGSASNFALAAARLGAEVSIIASLGDDPLGKIYLKTMEQGGVETSLLKVAEGRRTGLVVIINVLAQSRRMIESPGANEELTPMDIMERSGDIRSADEVHLASVRVPIARAVLDVRKGISWDPGMRILSKSREECWKLLSSVGKIFLNEKEAMLLSGEKDPEEAARKIAREGPDEVLIKMGPRGSLALIEGSMCHVKAIPVNVVDTTGAGDVFAAAYLVSRAKGFPPQKSVRLANSAAALTISRPGTMYGLPVWDEIAAMEFISYGKGDDEC